MTSSQNSQIISRVGHTGIVVRNLDRSIAFYCDLLGLELQVRDERRGEYIDALVGLNEISLQFAVLGTKEQPYAIELLEYSRIDTNSSPRHSNSVGCNHIQFFVNDIEAAYRDLSARAIPFNSPPLLVPTGTRKAVYLRDPDGTIVEFNQILNTGPLYGTAEAKAPSESPHSR